MESTGGSAHFRTAPDEIMLSLNYPGLALGSNAPQELAAKLQLLVAIVTATGAQPPGSPPRPLPMLGAAVVVQGYRATVVQVTAGQVLCMFSDGQQRWMPLETVNPA